jgi:hypothetical protein
VPQTVAGLVNTDDEDRVVCELVERIQTMVEAEMASMRLNDIGGTECRNKG